MIKVPGKNRKGEKIFMAAKKTNNEKVKEEKVVEEKVVEDEVIENTEEKKNELGGFKPDNDDQGEESEDEAVLKFTTGEVHGCGRLKLRERPIANEKSKVIKLLKSGEIVDINLADSTENFYKVTHGTSTSKVEGFCMKKFIKV